MSKLLKWLDQNALLYLAGFLLVFIPLYPKLPLFDAIPGYIVRVRWEDFVILFTTIVWFVQLIRRKVSLHPLMTKLFIIYIIIGFISCLSAIFITKTVPMSMIHIEKLFLNYIRRIEYFSLFFIFYSAIKTFRQVKICMSMLIGIMLIVAVYGFGQKYFYWPVISTMNREFSKGWVLYLSDHARVPSTFGGHYDAAAFTMIALTILLSIIWFAKSKLMKITAMISFLAGLWLLILTASRTSFIAYLGAISLLTLMTMFVKKWWWPIPRYLVVLTISLVAMLSFGDLSERFTQILGLTRFRDQFSNLLLAAKIDKPKNGQAVSDISLVTTPDDTPPSPNKPVLPADVNYSPPLTVPVTDVEGQYTGSYTSISRTYSDNAYKYGLSAAIRLDTTWPLAIAGFKKNPLLGSGYSTLSKTSVDEFTEAESTDNDFLRNLGESGLLGFISFYATVIAGAVIAFKAIGKTDDPTIKAMLMGYVAANVGLLANGVYIDVFEASKVAEVFWALTGIAVSLSMMKPEIVSKVKAKTVK